MKSDELQATEIYARFAEEVYDDFGDSRQEQEYYRKEHADAAIAELKEENRKLKRALWLARAERALSEQYVISNAVLYLENKFNHKFNSVRHELHVWGVVKRKSRSKAKEYK